MCSNFISLITVAMLLTASCGTTENKETKIDSVTVDTTNIGNSGVTVSEPVAPVSKRISDSIYNGEYVEKYETGIIYKRGEIAGGLAEGEWLTFYRDGKLWSKGNYHNGLRTGYAVSYWPNGQKSSEGYYAEGKMVGNWIWWNEEGKSVAKTFPGTPDTTKYKKVRPR